MAVPFGQPGELGRGGIGEGSYKVRDVPAAPSPAACRLFYSESLIAVA